LLKHLEKGAIAWLCKNVKASFRMKTNFVVETRHVEMESQNEC